MHLRILTGDDADTFQRLRLQSLKDEPSAFASSYEEECDFTTAFIADRLKAENSVVAGAFEDSADNQAPGLIGIAGVTQEQHRKVAHKSCLWGVYVRPDYRGRGIGHRVVSTAIAEAFQNPQIRQINLGVNTNNNPAIRVYEAVGFTTFGTERNCLLVDGVAFDELHMVCFRENFMVQS